MRVLVVAPVDVIVNIDKFRSFFDDRRFAVMHQDGYRLGFVNARYGGRHGSALGP